VLFTLPNVLAEAELTHLRARLAQADWVDGKVTAGYQASQVKQNKQIPENSPISRELGEIVLAALARSPQFISAALPLRVFPPMFNSYAGGQTFGAHVDTAIRQLASTGQRIRTDLSATLFLTAPEDYDGGELDIHDTYGLHSIKLPAGSLVLYPATSLHAVRPVTRGARVSSFFWLQSMIRDEAQRTILYDLDTAIQKLASDTPNHPSSLTFTAVYHNLLRQWSEL
jgi:PKHD-type hydroxylase